MRTRRSGFTLAELLVGLVVTSIVLAATAAIFIGVQNSYQAETEAKVITENGRAALVFLERVVPMAGFGIDPRLAFDRSTTYNVDNQDVRAQTFSPAQTAMQPATANIIVTDSLMFRFRDPSFLRTGRVNSASSPNSVTFDAGPGTLPNLPIGKLLMVMCRGGVEYLMVRTTAAVSGSSVAVAPQTASPFQNNTNSCLANAAGAQSSYVFIIQEHHLRIVNLGGRPWLVSFRNLSQDPLTLTNAFDPIAPDVELFQVAFGMNRARPALGFNTAPDATGGNSNWVMGDSGTEVLPPQPTNILTTAPNYRTSYDDADRYTNNLANIRSVHVAMVMRSSRTSPTRRTSLTSPSIFNYSAPTQANSTYDRSTFHTAIMTPNLMSRTGFVPALRSGGDLRDLNSWGG